MFSTGHTELVTRILETIAAQLTDAGDVTPIRNSRANDQITVEDFVEAQKRRPKVCLDWFAEHDRRMI